MEASKPEGISLCMIVRDEEFFIQHMLASAREYVDEVILVDTGSVDNTVEIARPLVDRLEFFSWVDDFAAARNYSLQFAKFRWILVLDADEVIAPQDYERLRELMSDSDRDGYYLIQRQYSDNADGADSQWIPVAINDEYAGDFRGYRENRILRFFRNNKDICYRGRIHEIVDYSLDSDRIGSTDIPIHHHHSNPDWGTRDHAMRDLAIMEQIIAEGAATGREYSLAGAVHLRVTGNYSAAIDYLTHALALGEKPISTREAIAEAHYRAGNLSEAITEYRTLYALGATSSAIKNNLSNLLVRTGELGEAADLLEEILDEGVSDPVRKARIEGNLMALRGEIERQRKEKS